MITAISGAVDTLGNLLSAPVDDYYSRKAEERQEEANIRAEGREQNYIISAEQRANEEYDRRLADQRAYDDPQAVAARYARAGINPVSAFQSGVVGQTGSISPSGGRAPASKPITAQKANFTAPQTLDVISSLAQIENINANTKKVQEETNSEREKGYSQFIDNCMQKVLIGDVNMSYDSNFNFDAKYSVVVDDEGNVSLPKLDKDVSKLITDKNSQYSKQMADMTFARFDNDVYGSLKIHTQSYWLSELTNKIANLEGMNHQLAKDIASHAIPLYCSILTAMASGDQADAALVTAHARNLEARFKYGVGEEGDFNTKWIIQTIFDGISAGKNVVDILMSVVPKGVRTIVKELFDADGTHQQTTVTTQK